MNEPISASLRAVQHIGAEAFGATALASDVGPTVRRVGRRRAGRVAGAGVVAAAFVATATVGAFAYADRPVTPGGPTDPSPTIATNAPVETVRVTVNAGDTARVIFAQLHDELGIPLADLEAAAANPGALGLPAEANGSVEGWLAPDAYVFDAGTSATSALSTMVAATVADLDERGVAPADRLRVLTIASLIETEVRLDSDRPKVARVIENRLDAGMPLEFDSTVKYANGEDPNYWDHLDEGSAWTDQDARNVDSTYNTYVVTGLPPGPIASPGMASIQGALHPADGTWLYFVAINLDTGETAYATTFEEHIANVEKLRAYIMANEQS